MSHPDPDLLAQRFVRLAAAAKALYRAAHWMPDRECDAATLWTELRDAAGMPTGTAPPPNQELHDFLEEIVRRDGAHAKVAQAALARLR